MSAPIVPQRPSRSQQPQPPTAPVEVQQPRVPPRPIRTKDRSISPSVDRYARSPLNDWSNYRNSKINGGSGSNLAVNLPQRPPSVDLPSIGQEGNEYAALPETPTGLSDPASPTQFKAAGDIPIHQPKASLPAQVAKTRVSGVTRTDSDQAAALGIGKPSSAEPGAQRKHGESRSHSRAPSSGAPSRPGSIMQNEEAEHGIPEIGIQVPMYPNAGDVQAPTPSPYDPKPHTAGVGFFNDGTHAPGRRHERTKSGREVFTCPPGSYGLHGHGQVPRDQFESAWYDKHPDEMKKEARGAYGPAISEGRKEWAMSSDDLNELVREGGAKGPNMGTSVAFVGAPDEYVGYQASEEYASRIHSPRPPSAGVGLHKTRTSSGTAHAESPLRKMSFPVNELNPVIKRGTSNEHAMDTEDEDDVIHVEPLSRVQSKYTGAGYDPPTVDLGPQGGNTDARGGIIDEQGYGVPILASDEVAKRPGMEYLQPAVPPEQEYADDSIYLGVDPEGQPIYKSLSHSRPHSRNNSVTALNRFTSRDEGIHTPLDDVKEYEPLFPEEAEKAKKLQQKRPDLARHHFPSKDIWEDTPSSLMYVTTVETPPPDAEQRQAEQQQAPSKTFESPEAEEKRKNILSQDDREDFLSEHTRKFAKNKFNKDLLGDMPTRPGLQHRFPSQDVWEDTPSESMMTTVINPEPEQNQLVGSPPDGKKEVPQIPGRPSKAQQPIIPPRPSHAIDKESSPTEAKKAPIIPDRPKPHVPARPTKTRDIIGSTPLTKSTSITSDGSAGSDAPSEGTITEKKAPPPRPAKQFGGIKGGFISELQNKLQLGPQAPKKEAPPEVEEPEVDKAPLADARKGRARGPQRRKPAASPSAAVANETATAAPSKFSIVPIGSIFEIDDEGNLEVGKSDKASPSQIVMPATAVVETVPDTVEPETAPAQANAPSEPEPQYFDAGSPETSTKAHAAASSQTTAEELALPAAEVPMSEASEAHGDSLASDTAQAEEKATQTGQQDISAGFEGDEKQKLTAFVDAHPQEGSVVAQEGETAVEPKVAAPEAD